MKKKNFKMLMATSFLPIFYGFLMISMMKALSDYGALLIPVLFIVAFIKSYMMYDIKTMRASTFIGAYLGEIILLTMSYTIPFGLSSRLFIYSFCTGVIFRTLAKNIEKIA